MNLAYRNTIYDGRPPIPLSWDVKLADRVVHDLWKDGLETLLHLIPPGCPSTNEVGHHHPSFNVKELQNIFEKIDFSALIFQENHTLIFLELLDFLRWLIADVSLSLLLQLQWLWVLIVDDLIQTGTTRAVSITTSQENSVEGLRSHSHSGG